MAKGHIFKRSNFVYIIIFAVGADLIMEFFGMLAYQKNYIIKDAGR